jgi:tetratricopeptide (TPR) repeat protein
MTTAVCERVMSLRPPSSRWITLALLAGFLYGCDEEDEGKGSALPEPPQPQASLDLDPEVAIAIERAREAVSASRGNGEAWLRLGKTYEANKLPQEAALSYETAVRLSPGDAGAWYRLGRACTKLGAFAPALEALKRAGELEPTNLQIILRRGFARLETGDLDGAKAEFQQAAALQAGDLAALTGLARVALQRGEDAAAAALLERLIEGAPGEPYFHRLLGGAYRALGRPRQAEASLRRGGARAMPEFHDPWEEELDAFAAGFAGARDRALTAFAAGNLPEAIRLLRELLQSRPGDGSLSYALGVAYMQTGEAQEAIEVLEAGVELNESHNLLHMALADAYGQSGQLHKALAQATRAVELNSTDFATHFRKAGILKVLERQQDALESGEAALARDPRNPAGLQFLAQLYAENKNWSSASQIYERLVDLQPEEPRFWLGLGIARMRHGALDSAQEAIDRADSLGAGTWRGALAQTRAELSRRRSKANGE